MKAVGLACLLLAGCAESSAKVLPLAQVAKALTEAEAHKDPDNPLHKVEVFPIPGEETLFVATRDWIDGWSGNFVCFKFENDRISWTAENPHEPQEHSILGLSGRFHKSV